MHTLFFQPHMQVRSDTVANTFHGTDYQITVLSWYLIDHLINQVEDYEITTEPAGIEKFDDVVLLTHTKKEFVQVKHSADPHGVYEINDFAGKTTNGKKVQLHSYFDAWVNLLQNKPNVQIPYQFVIFSNHTLSTKKGFHHCIDKNGKFVEAFWKRMPQYKTGNIKSPAYINNPQYCIEWHSDWLFNSILYNSNTIKEDPDLCTGKISLRYGLNGIGLIQLFFQQLTFRLGESNRKQLAEKVKTQLREHFQVNSDAIGDALYVKVKNWLAEKQALTFTAQTIHSFLQSQHATIYIERLYGLTCQRIQNTTNTIANQYILTRTKEVAVLNDFLDANKENVLLLTGEAGVGKSALIKNLFTSKEHLPGQFIFVDVIELNNLIKTDKRPVHIETAERFRLLCLDNGELIFNLPKLEQNRILTLFQNVRETQKIIITVQKEWVTSMENILKTNKVIYQQHSMSFLNVDNLPADFPQACVELFKYNNHLRHILCRPFYLDLFIKHEQHLLQQPHNIYFSTWDSSCKFLLKLAITRPIRNAPQTNKTIKKRLTILKKLAYRKSKMGLTSVSLEVPNDEIPIIESLVADGILIALNNGCYNFAHPLFEEWVIHKIVSQHIKQALESDEDPDSLLAILERQLAAYKRTYESILLRREDILRCAQANESKALLMLHQLNNISKDDFKLDEQDCMSDRDFTSIICEAIISGNINVVQMIIDYVNDHRHITFDSAKVQQAIIATYHHTDLLKYFLKNQFLDYSSLTKILVSSAKNNHIPSLVCSLNALHPDAMQYKIEHIWDYDNEDYFHNDETEVYQDAFEGAIEEAVYYNHIEATTLMLKHNPIYKLRKKHRQVYEDEYENKYEDTFESLLETAIERFDTRTEDLSIFTHLLDRTEDSDIIKNAIKKASEKRNINVLLAIFNKINTLDLLTSAFEYLLKPNDVPFKCFSLLISKKNGIDAILAASENIANYIGLLNYQFYDNCDDNCKIEIGLILKHIEDIFRLILLTAKEYNQYFGILTQINEKLGNLLDLTKFTKIEEELTIEAIDDEQLENYLNVEMPHIIFHPSA